MAVDLCAERLLSGICTGIIALRFPIWLHFTGVHHFFVNIMDVPRLLFCWTPPLKSRMLLVLICAQPRGCAWHRLTAEGAPSPRGGHSLTACNGSFVVYGGIGPGEVDDASSAPKDDAYILTLSSEAPNPRQLLYTTLKANVRDHIQSPTKSFRKHTLAHMGNAICF